MKKSCSAGQVFLAFALLASRGWAQPGGAPPSATPESPSPDAPNQDTPKQDAQKQDAPKQDAVKEPPAKPNEKAVEKPDVLATATIDALAKAGCEYVGTGISPVLIRNARGQRVQLRALTQKCNNPDPAFGRRTALQVLSDVRVVLKSPDLSQVISATISGGYITIDYVPEGLKDQTTFSISTSASDKPIAHLEIQVASIAVDKLAVRYTNQALDDRQDGRARGVDSGDLAPVAVAMLPSLPAKKEYSKPSNIPIDAPSLHADDDDSGDGDEWATDIENTVTLKLPPSLSAISSERDVWIASSSTWPIKFSPGSTVEPPRPDASGVPSEDIGLRPNETALYRVQEISFSVANRQTKPLRMTLALRHLGGPYDPENGDWFTVDVMLASEARYESIPLPLERQLGVSCASGKSTQFSTTVHDIQMDDDALRTQGCRIFVNPAYASTLTAFGRQVVKVTVSRTKATAHTSTWNLDRHSSEFILPPPDDDDRGEGPYSVRAEITLDKTVYRSTTDTDVATHPDYVFTATLQPRGKYATFQHARLYGTFPVDVLAMRFPAVMREVDRSSDGSASQLIPFRVGLAVVVEPWDYARNRNPWPVPLQGSIGLSVVELSQKRLAPSFQVGGSVILGTVGEKVPTTVTLGLFYELDLTEPSHGSHFLVTSSVNFLSLFDTK